MEHDQIFSTERILPYPPSVVYAAFASPQLLAQWWGPKDFTNAFEIFEFKPGGRWQFVMHGPDGKNYSNRNQFIELVADQKIVIKHDCLPYFTLTVELTAVANGTHLRWQQVLADLDTARAIKDIVQPANEQNLDRLTRLLA